MPKLEMKKLMGKSPDRPDALALTFWETDKPPKKANKSQNSEKYIINPITGEKIVKKHLSRNQRLP